MPRRLVAGSRQHLVTVFGKSGEPSYGPATNAACLSAGAGIGVGKSITCTNAARIGIVPGCFAPGFAKSDPGKASGPWAASWSACMEDGLARLRIQLRLAGIRLPILFPFARNPTHPAC